MKKISMLLTMILVALVVTACSSKEKLRIYLPNAYIKEDLIDAFEDEFGVKVEYGTFDDNESAMMQLKDTSNSFDIVIPSDYSIEELVKLDLIEALDWSKIPNLNKDNDLVSELQDILGMLKEDGFDFLKYAAPYFFGNVGILYRTDRVTTEELETLQWNIFKKNGINPVIYDSSRDAFMMAIKSTGNHPLNQATQEQINAASDWLKAVKNSKSERILSDQILNAPGILTQDVIQVYSGDAVYIMDVNEKYQYFQPTFTNVWVDGFVIPKNAKNKDLAYQFINFMLREDIATENTLEVMYTTPIQSVYEDVVSDEEGFNDERLLTAYHVFIHETDEFFRYNDALKRMIDTAWNLVKAA